MRIACSGCSAAYEVPAESLPPGRTVRCVRCGTTWTPVAQVDAIPDIVPRPDLALLRPNPAIPAAGETGIEKPAADDPIVAPAVVQPAGALTGGQQMVAPLDPAVAPADAAVDAFSPVEAPPRLPGAELPLPMVIVPPRPSHSGLVVMAGWLMTIALLALIGWVGVTKRADIMHAWPQSERLYVLLGLVK